MMTIIGCIVDKHDPWLVLMASIICAAGSWATIRLFQRASVAQSTERAAWIVMSALVAGASIWCTHFVAMLGYDPGLPVSFDPVLTIVSLLVALLGSGVGFLVATGAGRIAPATGGAIVGLAIVVMHYTGMMAYRVQGIISWDLSYLVASAILSCTIAAAAVQAARFGGRETTRAIVASALFFLSIVALHFTGMTAFGVTPMLMEGSFADPEALSAMALAVSCVGLVIVGAGLASGFIDTKARATAADALSHMSNGLTMVSASGVVTLVNDRVGELFKLEKGTIKVGMTLEAYVGLIGARAGWDGERISRILANHRLWMEAGHTTRVEHHFDDDTTLEITCQPVTRGGAILTYEDITEARNGQRTIAHMAFHDALTGLKNRRMFSKSMEELLASELVTMLMIDLDRFKDVNDRLGHTVGDELLRQVAGRIETVLRQDEQAYRLGGDELAVLLPAQTERAEAMARDIVASVSIPFQIGAHVVVTGCSVGVATSRLDDDASTLQRKADLALYAAKNGGRARVEVYREGMLEEEASKRIFEQDLAIAIERGQFELWYQPLFGLPGRTLTGFEALVRWRHPVRGLVPPAEFIPVAERCGLITAIGAWVIDEACRCAAQWPDELYMSINISAVQLRSAAMASQLAQALAIHGVAASRIEIEITETAMVENSTQIAVMLAGLRALGVKIAMDDFGTGYSSLAHLREFKVDRIKIDRSFIAAFRDDAGSAAIVRAVLSMARELEIDTTAEGIEHEDQLQSLIELGCGTAQGYLLGRPLPHGVADAIVQTAFVTEGHEAERRWPGAPAA